MWSEDFQDGLCGGGILEQNDFSNSESLCNSDASHQLKVWEEMSIEEFQDGQSGSHLGYQNETMLAILTLHVSPMPPTKFLLNPTYHSGADVI